MAEPGSRAVAALGGAVRPSQGQTAGHDIDFRPKGAAKILNINGNIAAKGQFLTRRRVRRLEIGEGDLGRAQVQPISGLVAPGTKQGCGFVRLGAGGKGHQGEAQQSNQNLNSDDIAHGRSFSYILATFWQNWKIFVLKALSMAFGQLGDPRIQKVIGISIGLALAVFAGLILLTYQLIGAFSGLDGWWGDAAQILGTFAAVVIAWFTFPMVAVVTAALFSDQVIDAVMARYYPERPMPQQVSMLAAILDGLKMAIVALVANILILPFLFVPPVYAALAYGLNGYLLGREYFEMPAFRRLAKPLAKDLFRRHRGQFILAGIVIAVLSTIPLLNLIAPVIGIAFMVHIFESVVNLETRRG